MHRQECLIMESRGSCLPAQRRGAALKECSITLDWPLCNRTEAPNGGGFWESGAVKITVIEDPAT